MTACLSPRHCPSHPALHGSVFPSFPNHDFWSSADLVHCGRGQRDPKTRLQPAAARSFQDGEEMPRNPESAEPSSTCMGGPGVQRGLQRGAPHLASPQITLTILAGVCVNYWLFPRARHEQPSL